MQYFYKVIDTNGKRSSGQIEAPDRDAAINALQRRGLVITSLEEGEGGEGTKAALSQEITWFERITTKDVVVLSRQIATLFEAQVSALRVFRLMAEEAQKSKLRTVLIKVADDIESGKAISSALEQHPHVFSDFYVSMVRAGEETGKLDETFLFLADHLDRMYEINAKARNALIYPAFVLVVFAFVMGLMFTTVIPQISTVLEETGQELPIYTKIVLGVSSFFANYWVFVLAGLVIVGVVLLKYIQTEKGKHALDEFLLGIPYVNVLIRNLALARMADNMNTMLSSGIQMVRALEVARDTLTNSVYRRILTNAANDVRGGTALSASIAQYEEMPGVMVQMVKVGEETGELGSLLKTLAKFYEREVENSIDNLVSLIEPAMIVVLGLGVGVLLAAVIMPIYNLAGGF